MTVNEFCSRIRNSESKFMSHVLVIPAHCDFSAVCSSYGNSFSVVAISRFVRSDGFIPMAERVFEELESKRQELKAQGKQMIVVGLDGYLSLLDRAVVRDAFNLIAGYLKGVERDTVIFVFRQKWTEMAVAFTHPSIISNSLCCTVGKEAEPAVSGNRYILVNKTFSRRLPKCHSDWSTYLKTLEQWAPQSNENVCIAVGFNGAHKFPGLSRDVRQFCILKEFLFECCEFTADLTDDAFRWIEKNTSGTEIVKELTTHFFPNGVRSICEVALSRHEEICRIDEREVFQQVLRTIAPIGSFLADVLARVAKHPDRFLEFYINVADEVLNSERASELAEERNAAVRRRGIGSTGVESFVDELIRRTKDWPAAKMVPWLQLGLEAEEAEWIRRAVAGKEEERGLACKQSKLLTAYHLADGFDKYPELAEYMADYREQKCADKVSDEFVAKAFKSSIPDKIDSRRARLSEFKTDPETVLLVVDALGAEYIPFLIARCRAHRFDPKVIDCVRVNLPTSTPYNSVDEEWGVASSYRKYNGFDSLLHKSFGDHVKALTAELRELDIQVMGEVEGLLNTYRRVVLTADHGATRLAVIARRDGQSRDIKEFESRLTVLDWRYAERNRVEYFNSDLVAESIGNNFVMVRGYNRFSKSGAPGFEMHGGATIEEQVVPFLVIERATVLTHAEQNVATAASTPDATEQMSEKADFDI